MRRPIRGLTKEAAGTRHWYDHTHGLSNDDSTQSARDHHPPREDRNFQDMARSHKHTPQANAAKRKVQGRKKSRNHNRYHRGENPTYGDAYAQGPENYSLSQSSRRATTDRMSSAAQPRSHSHRDTWNAASGHDHHWEQDTGSGPWDEEADRRIKSTWGFAVLDEDDELWALDYPITETRRPVQQRLEAMAGTMALQDIQECHEPTLVASRLFRNVDDKESLSNVNTTPHWNAVYEDPVFALIPTDGEITSFDELHVRKEAMAAEARPMYIRRRILPEASPRESSDEEEGLVTPSVTSPSRPPSQLPTTVEATSAQRTAPRHPWPVLLNYGDPYEPPDPAADPRQSRAGGLPQDHDDWRMQMRTWQREYERQHPNQFQRQQENKTNEKVGRQNNPPPHGPRGSGSSHHRVDFRSYNDPRQDSRPGRQGSRRNRQGRKNNKRGQKQSPKNPEQYVTGEAGGSEKRRRLN
ncbi:hypothetical protein LTS17_004395 [Exophiala oligosperma]